MPLKIGGGEVPGMIRDKLDYDSISLLRKKNKEMIKLSMKKCIFS